MVLWVMVRETPELDNGTLSNFQCIETALRSPNIKELQWRNSFSVNIQYFRDLRIGWVSTVTRGHGYEVAEGEKGATGAKHCTGCELKCTPIKCVYGWYIFHSIAFMVEKRNRRNAQHELRMLSIRRIHFWSQKQLWSTGCVTFRP